MEEESELEEKVKTLEAKLDALKVFNPIPANTPAPRYDGQGDFHAFLRKFNIYATAANWEPKECVRMLPSFYLATHWKSTWVSITIRRTHGRN